MDCMHCGEVITAKRACPGRDNPGGPCEPDQLKMEKGASDLIANASVAPGSPDKVLL